MVRATVAQQYGKISQGLFDVQIQFQGKKEKEGFLLQHQSDTKIHNMKYNSQYQHTVLEY